MAVFFEIDDLPIDGSRLVLSRAGEEDQTFTLIGHKPHTTVDGEASALLRWESDCRDCGKGYEFDRGLDTQSFYRRCKRCRRGYNKGKQKGWPKGPRVRHTLLAPAKGYKPKRDKAPEVRWPLYDAMKAGDVGAAATLVAAVRREPGRESLSIESARDIVESRLRDAEDEIDPASLF